MTRQAYGYIRVSSHEQKNKSGPNRSEERIRAYAKSNGYGIARVFIEDISGTVNYALRPVFNEMLKEIVTDGVNHVLVEDLRALARSVDIQHQILSYFALKDIHLIVCETGADATEAFQQKDSNKAMISMMGVFFEWEKDRIVARLQRGRQISGRRGGRPSYYSNRLKGRIKILRSKGNSYNQIADRFNLEEVKTSTGRSWSPQLVRIVGMEATK